MDDVQNGINAQMHDVQQTISDLNDNVDERSGSSNNIVYRRESKAGYYLYILWRRPKTKKYDWWDPNFTLIVPKTVLYEEEMSGTLSDSNNIHMTMSCGIRHRRWKICFVGIFVGSHRWKDQTRLRSRLTSVSTLWSPRFFKTPTEVTFYPLGW